MLKRIMTCVLSIAVVLALAVHAVPAASAVPLHAQAMASADKGACDHPCAGGGSAMADCVDGLCCLSFSAFLAAPALAAAPIGWSVVSYHTVDAARTGLAPLPELFPPILHA